MRGWERGYEGNRDGKAGRTACFSRKYWGGLGWKTITMDVRVRSQGSA